jgi:hypothetical protein
VQVYSRKTKTVNKNGYFFLVMSIGTNLNIIYFKSIFGCRNKEKMAFIFANVYQV